jgi:mono/diheme cytochrome c family protein
MMKLERCPLETTRLFAIFACLLGCLGMSHQIWAVSPSSNPEMFLGIEPNAQKGYELITTKPMGRPLMKIKDIDRMWQVWEEEERALAEKADPDERRRMTFERYGWITRPGDDRPGLPLGYTEDGKGGITNNCFSCHGGKVAGKTIPGSGNTHVDLTALTTDLAKLRALDAGRDPNTVKSGLPFVANYHKGFTNAVIFEVLNWVQANPDVMLKVGMNPKLLAHHDMNPPAWWTTKRKERLYTDQFAPKTPRQNMPFARGRGPEGWEAKWHALEPDFVHIYQYIEELEVPKYPFEIDTDLAAKGNALFVKTCAECHGSYGPDGEFPNVIVPIEDIGTDAVRLTAVPKDDRIWNNKTWLQYGGKYPVWEESEGYLAPPLDGVWASAPYFHNGAAPTLTAVMNPSDRPKVWKRSENGYDKVNVGLEVEVFDSVPEGLSDRQRRMHYDTSHFGNTNTGHTFPDTLDADEKIAVIEYLKTL